MGFLDSIFGSNDPSTADPNNGLTDFERRQAAFSTLGHTGAILLAAGQDQLPQQRAQILAQLGTVPGQTQEQLSSMAKMKLMNQQGQLAKQNAAKQGALEKYLSDPAFLSQLEGLPPELKAAAIASAKAGDIGSVTKLLAQNSADTRQERMLQQQQKGLDARERIAQAHDDAKPVPLGPGSFFDRRTGMIHTLDPLTGKVTSAPMTPQAAPSLSAPPAAAPPVGAPPGAGINPPPMPPEAGPGMGVFAPPTPPVQVPASPGAPMVQAPVPLTPAQSALARPPVIPTGGAAPPGLQPQGGGEPEIDPKLAEAHGGQPIKMPEGFTAPSNPNLNWKVLDDVLPQYRNLIKAYVEGRQPIPTAAALRNPLTAALLAKAHEVDGTFDAGNYPARASFIKSYASGKIFDTLKSANTFLNHADSYLDATDALGLDNGMTAHVTNPLKIAAMMANNDPKLTRVQTNMKPLLDEFAKFMGGKGQLTDAARKEYGDMLKSAQTPEQTRAVLGKMVELMNGQLQPISEQATSVMGANATPMDFIKPSAQKSLARVTGADYQAPGDTRPAGHGQPALPAAAASRLEEGKQTTFGNGQVWTKKGGQPVRVQ